MNHADSQLPSRIERDFAWLKTVRPELAGWLSETFTYIAAEYMCEVFERGRVIGITLYSNKNAYSIVCGNTDANYLGMTHGDRVTHAGNDHSEGPYSENTWNRILRDILSCELISLERVADPNHED